MADIVQRLRHLAKLLGLDLPAILNEAADEIERLRKDIERLQSLAESMGEDNERLIREYMGEARNG